MKKKLIFALLILVLVVSSVGAQTITITLLGAKAVATPTVEPEPVTTLTAWEKIQNFFSMMYTYFTQLFYSGNFAY